MLKIMNANNMMKCIFGQGVFKVIPKTTNVLIQGAPILTDKDLQIIQTPPLCISPANPEVKLPFKPIGTCNFVGAAWIQPSLTFTANNAKALIQTSTIMCTIGQGLLTFMP